MTDNKIFKIGYYTKDGKLIDQFSYEYCNKISVVKSICTKFLDKHHYIDHIKIFEKLSNVVIFRTRDQEWKEIEYNV